jgi:hypothetical protein
MWSLGVARLQPSPLHDPVADSKPWAPNNKDTGCLIAYDLVCPAVDGVSWNDVAEHRHALNPDIRQPAPKLEVCVDQIIDLADNRRGRLREITSHRLLSAF